MVANQIDTLLANYVAGVLPTPVRVLVESHLQLKPGNRAITDVLENMAGEALDDFEAEELSDRNALLKSVLSSSAPAVAAPRERQAGVFPPALRDYLGFDLDRVPWKTRLPGYRSHDLGEVDGLHVSLFSFRPNRVVPAHTHSGTELSLVLGGGFSDELGHYAAGDISIADAEVDHRPVADPGEPCIGFQVIEGPLKLTGPFVQRLRDLIG
ncbi:MAG: transcriptional regulator [Rhizobiales bacterium]|nr:transcriptional regulator [Hyphomicrobiales bacterium]MBA68509.1 transcriptional regulator [Hyphomicrobiales bacterium]|tara:strand:+ start:524 stop:1156 length:633 start_codon:yes stop_codon:yes gene_type:complete